MSIGDCWSPLSQSEAGALLTASVSGAAKVASGAAAAAVLLPGGEVDAEVGASEDSAAMVIAIRIVGTGFDMVGLLRGKFRNTIDLGLLSH